MVVGLFNSQIMTRICDSIELLFCCSYFYTAWLINPNYLLSGYEGEGFGCGGMTSCDNKTIKLKIKTFAIIAYQAPA